jgi:hypothetical protein
VWVQIRGPLGLPSCKKKRASQDATSHLAFWTQGICKGCYVPSPEGELDDASRGPPNETRVFSEAEGLGQPHWTDNFSKVILLAYVRLFMYCTLSLVERENRSKRVCMRNERIHQSVSFVLHWLLFHRKAGPIH